MFYGMTATLDRTTTKAKRVLMVVANPTTSTTTGWPVGFWASELFHPLYEFTEAGYDVTVASPDGGDVEIDGMSDPRDESRYSEEDVLSLGYLSSEEQTAPTSICRRRCGASTRPRSRPRPSATA
jgi:hypothetical protein